MCNVKKFFHSQTLHLLCRKFINEDGMGQGYHETVGKGRT